MSFPLNDPVSGKAFTQGQVLDIFVKPPNIVENLTVIDPNANPALTTAQAVQAQLQFLEQLAYNTTDAASKRVDTAIATLQGAEFDLTAKQSMPFYKVYELPSDVVKGIQVGMQTYPLGTNYAKNIVDGMANAWFMKYFPAALPNGIDTLLQAVTQTLVSDAMQEIIWSRARSQGLRDNARFEDEQVTTWASRGFSLPSGVLANQLMMKQQALAFTNADLAAQQAIKSLDIQVDGIKFAAEISVKLQLGLIEGMKGMIATYASVADAEMGHNVSTTNAANTLYSAVTGYYDTLIRNADTENRLALGKQDIDIKRDTIMHAAWGELVQETIKSNLTSAQIYAQIATQALGGLHSVTSASIT
jgi:hypothetical protein